VEKRLSLAILAILLLVQPVQAISLGTLVKKDSVSINPGESAKFTVLFWNVENLEERVEVKVEKTPKDWLVIVEPEEFFLNSSVGEEAIALPSGSVRALPVNILVRPSSFQSGNYTVVLVARAGLPREGISFFQERRFKLNLEILGEKLEQVENLKSNTTVQLPTGEAAKLQQNFYPLLYFLLVLCILVLSVLIYKYA
jgi:hypothetical protein